MFVFLVFCIVLNLRQLIQQTKHATNDNSSPSIIPLLDV